MCLYHRSVKEQTEQICQDPEVQKPSPDNAESLGTAEEDVNLGFLFVAGHRSKRENIVKVLLNLAQHDCSKVRKMALLTIMKIHFFDKDLFDKALQVKSGLRTT